MKDNILYDDNLQGNMLSNLQAMLDEALQAPDEERDYDSIAEITAAIARSQGDRSAMILFLFVLRRLPSRWSTLAAASVSAVW